MKKKNLLYPVSDTQLMIHCISELFFLLSKQFFLILE